MAKYSILLFLIIYNINIYAQKPCSSRIKQGIQGRILWKSENFRPEPKAKQYKFIPISREILVYQIEETTINGEVGLQSKFIKKTLSGKKGCFHIKLKEGNYTLHVKDPEGLHNEIFEIKIQKKQVLERIFEIDYSKNY